MHIYHGVVVNNQDPTRQGRVQVSLKELDGVGDGLSSVTNENLTWAEVMGSTMFGNVGGIGGSSVLHNGTEVYVVYNQDNTSSTPLVIGTIQGYTQDQSQDTEERKDPNGEFPYKDRLGQSSVNPAMTTDNDTYAYTQMIETRSGHQIILGDVTGKEYVKILHKSGSYINFDPEGNIFVNCVKNMTTTVAKNYTIDVQGNLKVTVQGTTSLDSTGNITENTKGNFQNTTSGTYIVKSDGNASFKNPHTTLDTAMVSCSANVESNSDMVAGGVSVMQHTHPYDHPVHVSGPADTSPPTATSSVSVQAVEVSEAPATGAIKDGSTVVTGMSTNTKQTPSGNVTSYTFTTAGGDSIVVNEQDGQKTFATSDMKSKASKIKYDVSSLDKDAQSEFVDGNAPAADDSTYSKLNDILTSAS